MQELKKKLYRRLLLNIAILGSIIIMLFLGVFNTFKHGDKKIGILLGIFLIGMQFFFLRQLIGCLLDWRTIKSNTVKKIEGIVVKVKIVEEGGDVITFARYPIVREEVTGKEYVMNIDNVQLGAKHVFLFLKHTKLAVIENGELNFK